MVKYIAVKRRELYTLIRSEFHRKTWFIYSTDYTLYDYIDTEVIILRIAL